MANAKHDTYGREVFEGPVNTLWSGLGLSSSCQTALCGHPLCWDANRGRMREFNRMIALHIKNKAKFQYPVIIENIPPNESSTGNEAADEEIFDADFPTLSTVDLANNFKVESNSVSSAKTFKNASYSKSMLWVGKLNVQNNSSTHLTTLAPANTPLHSMNELGDRREVQSQGSEVLSVKSRTLYHETKDNYYKKQYENMTPKLSLFNLNVPNVRKTRNKTLVWKPTKETSNKTEKIVEKKPPECGGHYTTLSMENINIRNSKTPHALKSRKPKTSPRMTRKKPSESVTYFTPRDSLERGTQTMETMATNEEIAILRAVPMDTLMQVLEQAEWIGVLQPRHSQILLKQVTGNIPPARQMDAIVNAEMPVGLQSKNMKILESPKIRSPRVIVETPMTAYKLDDQVTTRRGPYTAPAHSTTEVRQQLHAPMTADEQLQTKISNRSLDEQQHSATYERPLKQISMIFNEETTGVRPFQYQRQQRDIFLGPLPQDVSSSPETEFDSNYDAEVGGSTVLANPPSQIPSSEENRINSPPYRSAGTRSKTTDNAGLPSSLPSPYGSTIELWPQVQEEDYLIATSTIHNDPSSELIFIDSESEASIASEKKSLPSEEETMTGGQFPNLRSTEVQSPAPPPPSPEVELPSSHATESTPASRGISKLARDASSGKKSVVSQEDQTPVSPPESREKTEE